MKKLFLIFILFLLSFTSTYAQKLSGSLSSGIGISNFEHQSKTGYSIPLGLKVHYTLTNNIELGLYWNTTVRQFKIKDTNYFYNLGDARYHILSGEARFSQNLYQMNLHYNFPKRRFKPFISLGIGLFTGKGKLEGKYARDIESYYREGKLNFSFKNSECYTISIGATIKENESSSIRIITSYHFVTVEPDLSNSQEEGGNNYGIYLEYWFKLAI